MNLFDVTKGCDTLDAKPRNCTDLELRAYLEWLAKRDGIAIPANARFCARGIVVGGTVDRRGDTGGTVILAMPGYGVPQVVTCEIVDDAGEVVKAFPLPADKRGKLPMTAAQVREWSGIEPARKPRKKQAAVSVPASPHGDCGTAPEIAPAATHERAEIEPRGEIADTIAALVARIEALEAAAAPLVAEMPDAATPIGAGVKAPRSAAHARAIIRAWEHRRAARLARSIAADHMRMREQVQAMAYPIERDLGEARADLRAVNARYAKHRGKTRALFDLMRKERDNAMAAANRARGELARLQRGLADPTQPERASDLARLVRERDTARQACAALEQRAARSEQAAARLADSFDATISRALRAEAEVRRLAA